MFKYKVISGPYFAVFGLNTPGAGDAIQENMDQK